MAFYVELDASAPVSEEYWYGGYAEGDPVVGAAAVSSNTEQTVVAGFRVQSTGYLTAASSGIDCAPVAVRPTGGVSIGTVTTLFGGNYISATGIIPFPESSAYTFSTIIRTAGFRTIPQSSVIINGRKKWETVDESSDIWTEVTY